MKNRLAPIGFWAFVVIVVLAITIGGTVSWIHLRAADAGAGHYVRYPNRSEPVFEWIDSRTSGTCCQKEISP